jgi:hypothetical protein
VSEVARDVGGPRHADEHGLRRVRLDGQAELAEPVAVDDPVGAVEVDVEVVGGECVGGGREALGAGREISVVVLPGVAPQQEAPGGEQAE